VSFRSIASAILALSAMLSGIGSAVAQGYPNRTITLVAPYAAGGDSDFSGRNLAAVVPKYLGQPAIVVNQVGASGMIGSQRVRSSPADGYTLLIARGGSQAILPALDSKTPYKWNDFTFLSLLDLNPVVLVVKADSPHKTLKDLIDYLRANPGKLNYSTAGKSTTQDLSAQYLFQVAGLPKDVAVQIPYKSGGEATTAVLGNQVEFVFNNLTTMIGQIKAGALRPLLITTAQRSKALPDIATARELGFPQLESLTGWSGLYGPPGLPPEVVSRWTEALQKISQDPDWLRGNESIAGIASIRSPADTEKFAREQFELYEKLGDLLGIRQ
jgi:tripartite-type tricarboxylate transporter receptor subunit TctC